MRASFLFVSVLSSSVGLGAVGCGRTDLAGGDVLGDEDNVAAVGGTSSGSTSSGGTHSGGTHSGNTGGLATGGSAPSEAPLELFPETIPVASFGQPYSALFTAEGGVGSPYQFRLLEGALPPGIDLGADGKLSGTPKKQGEYSFRVGVKDLGGNDAERVYVLRVSGPRFLAYTTYLSTASSRSAVKIVDVTRSPLAPVTLLDDEANSLLFSPDGRWLSFVNNEGSPQRETVVYLVNTAGEEPGPLVPLLDEGHIYAWTAYTWSPDSNAIAYIKAAGAQFDLWTVEVLADGLGKRRLLVEDVASTGLSWPRADTLVYTDAQKRPNFLRFHASGSWTSTLVDAPEFVVVSMAPKEELAFAGNIETGFLLIDSATGGWQALEGFGEWFMAPTFTFLVARPWLFSSEFSLFAVNGTEPEQLLRSGESVMSMWGPYFAHAAPRFVQLENGRFVVTSVNGSTASVHEIDGDYASPLSDSNFGSNFGVYTPNDQQFVFTDPTALWVSAHTSDGPAKARKLTDFAATGMTISPDSRWLLATNGSPEVARLVPLDESSPEPIRNLSEGFAWTTHYWSADSQTLATLGGELDVRHLDDPLSAPQVVASCKGPNTTTTCPSTVAFQPWK